MPKFAAVDRVLDDTLVLPVPIPGQDEPKEYTVPPMTAKAGLYAQRMMNLAVSISVEQSRPHDPDKPRPEIKPSVVLDDGEEYDLYENVLGKPLLEQMLADGVTWPWVQRVAQTALLYATADADTAQAFWVSGGQGKARPAPRSSATGPSPKRAGQSGTKASRKARQKKARRGSGSSSGGR